MELLVLFRVLQGVAGAILVPGSLALLTANFEGEAQGRAFGLWAGASGATTILGPFIGGLLVDTISWRGALLINVPLIIVALGATYVHVPESRDETASRHFDWIGSAIVALAVGGLAFGTIYGQQRDWQDPLGYVALAVGVLCTIVLPFYMARVPHPLIPLSLFRSRNFTVTNISTLVIYGALYVTFYYLTLFVQGVVGYSAAAAGLAGIPGSLFITFLSARFGGLAGRIGSRWVMAVSPAIITVTDPAFRKAVSPLNPPHIPGLNELARDASTASFHLAMMVGAALLIIGAIVNAIGIQDPDRVTQRKVVPGGAQPVKEG